MPATLSRGAIRAVNAAVDRVFDRIKGRVIGPDFIRARGDKQIFIGHKPALSLPGIYRQAAAEEGSRADETMVHGLSKVAESYIDAQREATKARVLRSVNAWLADNKKADVQTVLGGELADVWGKVMSDVTKIIDTESTAARNLGTLEGITKVSAAHDIADPTVYWVTVRDTEMCEECKRLHLIDIDGHTIPRVWKLSEVSSGYHKRGDEHPCTSGLHPHCRCTIGNLMPGYGFDDTGNVKFIKLGWDEYARQRGSTPDEDS